MLSRRSGIARCVRPCGSHVSDAGVRRSILGDERPPIKPKGTEEDGLGPSGSSDSAATPRAPGADRASAEAGLEEPTNSDILPDRIGVFPDAAREASTTVESPEAANAEELADNIEPDDADKESA